jgi:hypothetical protein
MTDVVALTLQGLGNKAADEGKSVVVSCAAVD